MLTSEQIKEIAEYLKYSYSQRTELTKILNAASKENGENWDLEVTELLTEITTAKTTYETKLAEGNIKKVETTGEFNIEMTERDNELQGKKILYNNLLGKLFKLIELYPNVNSSYLVR